MQTPLWCFLSSRHALPQLSLIHSMKDGCFFLKFTKLVLTIEHLNEKRLKSFNPYLPCKFQLRELET